MKQTGKRNDKKNVSWIYRQKKKSLKKPNTNNDNASATTRNPNARIIIRNLPFKVTEREIRDIYSEYGKIQEINLPARPNGHLIGCGFVQFSRIEDASKAIFNTKNTLLHGRKLNPDWAIAKSKFVQKLENTVKTESSDDIKEEVTVDEVPNDEIIEEVKEEIKDEPIERDQNAVGSKNNKSKLDKKKQREITKQKNTERRARIIIRNLSFKATEKKLQDHFSQYGNVKEVQLLKKPDGKLVGCGFVQFELVQSAAKAIHYSNLKPFLDRPIVVDWAVPKNKFGKANEKTENDGKSDDPDKDEITLEDDDDEVKSIPESNTGKMDDSNLESDHEENSGSDEESGSDDEEESDDEKVDIKEEDKLSTRSDDHDEKRPRVISNDVSEGRTVFLKNVPFSVKNDELKRCVEQFGPVFYALVCVDPVTEHSKGTAFVKFKDPADAEKCLAAGSKLKIEDQILEVHRALHKNELEDKKNSDFKKAKDTRNLYLVKEGVIIAGTPAASGVSQTDMAKRLQLENWKSQMLRNLNMFVSRVRLVVHNLPPTMNDLRLREIFKKYAPPKAIIREARVMRNLRDIGSDGLGKPKDYGFVTFTTHEDALTALRNINNNPNVFHQHKRPIVAFSIENRIMVNAKERRVQKSREKNPLFQNKDNKTKEKNNESVKSNAPQKSFNNSAKSGTSNAQDNPAPFTGIIGKPGQTKMRTKFSLKNQGQIHSQNVTKDKKKLKQQKLLTQRKREWKEERDVKPSKRAKKNPSDDADFTKLVNNYKNKLASIDTKKLKWFES